jgi:ATP-binding cassette, subfamily F, member 3
MREALINAIAEYEGAVVIVSHDRFLIDATCDRLWLVAGGAVKPFEGDLDDYTKLILQARRTSKSGIEQKDPGFDDEDEEEVAAPKPATTVSAKQSEKLEEQIAKLTDLIAKVDEALAKPDVFRKNPEIAAQLAKDRANLAHKLASAEEDWLALAG